MGILAKKSGMYTRLSFENIRPGMRLLVRSKEWWERNANIVSGAQGVEIEEYVFVESMSRLCGQIVTVDSIFDGYKYELYPSPFIESDPKRPYITIVEPDGNPNGFCWTPGRFARIIN